MEKGKKQANLKNTQESAKNKLTQKETQKQTVKQPATNEKSLSKSPAPIKRGNKEVRNTSVESTNKRKSSQEPSRSGSNAKSKKVKKGMSSEKKKGKGKGKGKEKEEEKIVKVEDSDKILKPTKAPNAYILYANDTIPQLKKQDPNLAHRDAMAKAGKLWSNLSEKEKAPYIEKHNQFHKVYLKQASDLEDKGYFTMNDGTKSTDCEIPGQKRRAGNSVKRDVQKKRTSHNQEQARKDALKAQEKPPQTTAKTNLVKGQQKKNSMQDQEDDSDDIQVESD